MDANENFVSKLFSRNKPEIKIVEQEKNVEVHHEKLKEVRAFLPGHSYPFYAYSFNGEKNTGEIGPVRNYLPDYDILRLRSWQAYLESEIAQTVIGRFINWVIGSGLKLQSEPMKDFLNDVGIEFDAQKFTKQLESQFEIFRSSEWSDYSEMGDLDTLMKEAYKNAILGGDVLVVNRLDDELNIQLIDGCHIQSPGFGTDANPQNLEGGNILRHGVETDARGKHVAYWIKNINNQYERIPARSKKTGLKTAFLIYGLKYRLNNVRGIPLISAVMETLKKLERYKEATLGSAEERQKIVYQIVHQAFSDGTSPFVGSIVTAVNAGGKQEIPVTEEGKVIADKVTATTDKQTFNMPIGSEMKGLESKNELYFKDFYSVNIDIICATLGIPPDVAMSKYNSNYSASRAAIKDWENTLRISRNEFAKQGYKPVFDLFFEVQVLKNRISAPGYILARKSNDKWIMAAYKKARWVGTPVPHIDPLVEVKAEREKLGATGMALPLTTLEQATENLGGGESGANMEQYSIELQKSKDLQIEVPVVQPGINSGNKD